MVQVVPVLVQSKCLDKLFCFAPNLWNGPGPKVITLFSCSTQLSTKFQLLIKTKIKKFLALSLSDVVFIMLINVKMPTVVGILTFISRINFVHN